MNRVFKRLLIGKGAMFGSAALGEVAQPTPTKATDQITLTNVFDHIGAEVHSADVDGRATYFIDDGPSDGPSMVFLGDQGTSLTAFQLTEFNRTTRLGNYVWK